MSSQTGSALERSIAQFATICDAQMNRLLMFAKIFLYVKKLFTIIAFEIGILMVNHVRLKISKRVEDFSAFVTWNLLPRSWKFDARLEV